MHAGEVKRKCVHTVKNNNTPWPSIAQHGGMMSVHLLYCGGKKYTKPRQMDKEDRWCQRANGAVLTSLPPYYFSKTTDPDLKNGPSEGPRRLQPKCLSGCLTASEAPSLCTFGTSELVGLHLTISTTSQSWQAWHFHPLHVVNGPVWKWEVLEIFWVCVPLPSPSPSVISECNCPLTNEILSNINCSCQALDWDYFPRSSTSN